jgi:hypothetical protein
MSNSNQVRDLEAQIAELKAENAKLSAKKAKSMSMKIGTKGGLSVYGLGRFPVTLYKSQWNKLLSIVPDIKQFIDDNADKLKDKE